MEPVAKYTNVNNFSEPRLIRIVLPKNVSKMKHYAYEIHFNKQNNISHQTFTRWIEICRIL